MTIMDAIGRLDVLKANAYSPEQKIRWLSTLDGRIKREVLDAHEGDAGAGFTGYDEHTHMDTVLLVPEPYDDIYILWMQAQIDYFNGEYRKYNNAMAMFETAFQNFQDDYRKNHMPRGRLNRFLF